MIDIPPLFRVALGAAGVALFLAAMCRMRWISRETTLARVRAAAVAQASAGALLVLTATVRPDWLAWAAVATPAAAVAWSMATAHAWRHEQPSSMAKASRAAAAEVVRLRRDPPRWDDTVPVRSIHDRRNR